MKIAYLAVVLVALLSFANSGPLDTNVIGFLIPQIREEFAKTPVTIQIRSIMVLMANAYESWSQYTPQSRGFFVGGQFRRPASEHTVQNKNTAIAYAIHRWLTVLFPEQQAKWDNIFYTILALPVNNGTRDTSIPMGMANKCADNVIGFFEHDGFNSLGDEGGVIYNRVPYSDYTGYEPKNTPFDLQNPDRWQPLLDKDPFYQLKHQAFITVGAGNYKTFATDVRDVDVSAPRETLARDRRKYEKKTRDIIKASEDLTDFQKMSAEFWDNKFSSFGTIARFIAGDDLDHFVGTETLLNIALVDGIAAMWYYKRQFDAVRPITAVHYLKGNDNIRAWGGPFQGTVNMKGREWKSYLRTDAHPEYPSGTTCLCTIFAQSMRLWSGTNNLNFTIVRPARSSVIEPGLTPANDVVLTYPTYTHMAEECGISRFWGGVHFTEAIDEASRECGVIGTKAFNRFKRYLDGDNTVNNWH